MKNVIIVPNFLPEDQQKYLNDLIEKSKKDEQALFAVKAIIKTIEVVESFHKGKGQEVLKGAHIVTKNPEIYKKLINNTKSRKRISSYYKSKKIEEKGVDLKTTADFLVGLNKDDTAWMQLEGHKVSFEDGLIRGAVLFVLHMIDYLKYKFTGKNVGPLGLSEHIDSNPIVVPLKKGDIFDGLEDITLGEFIDAAKSNTSFQDRYTKSFVERVNKDKKLDVINQR